MIDMYHFTNLLATLQQIDFKAHIAGGAVRDTILKKEIRDVDLFIEDICADEAAVRLRRDHGYLKVGEWREYLGFSDPSMKRVAKFERADETIPVCVIGLVRGCASPKDNLARFDFGICMAAFDGNDILRLPEFEHDVAQKAFTLRRADNLGQFIYSMSRYEKIVAGRYSGWGLTIPAEFKDLAMEHTFHRHWYHDGDVFGLRDNLLRPKAREAA